MLSFESLADFLQSWKERARQLKTETYALYLAARDPRVPRTWVLAACVVAYAFSPIDLIPDFIPVLGYLDDLVLVPLGIVLVRKLIPSLVLAECRIAAQELLKQGKPVNRTAAVVIVAIWVALAASCALFLCISKLTVGTVDAAVRFRNLRNTAYIRR